MSQKCWDGVTSVQAALAEAREKLFRLAEPIPAGDSVKAQINRAAKRAKLSYTRAFDLWYSKARSIKASGMDAIRKAISDAQVKRTDELSALVSDFGQLAERAAKVLAVRDRHMADAFRSLAVQAGRLADRAD